MPYQKLQVSAGMPVIPSDTVNISNIGGTVLNSTATSTLASKLVDTTVDFNDLGIKIGDTVINQTDNTVALVTAIDNVNRLSISVDIMASGEEYSIVLEQVDSASACVLYLGVAGNLKVKTASGNVLTLVAAPAGFLPVQVTRVYATGTAATDIIAFW